MVGFVDIAKPGVSGLLEHSRAAHRHANQTPEDIEHMVIELRQAHMRWGPKKLKRLLERDEPGRTWPHSTIGALLKREGLVVARKKRIRTAPYTEPLGHANASPVPQCSVDSVYKVSGMCPVLNVKDPPGHTKSTGTLPRELK